MFQQMVYGKCGTVFTKPAVQYITRILKRTTALIIKVAEL